MTGPVYLTTLETLFREDLENLGIRQTVQRNEKPKDKTYNTFLSKILSHSTEILFELESMVSKKDDLETVDANFEQKDSIKNDDRNISDKRAVEKTDSKNNFTNSKYGKFKSRSARPRFLL